MINIKIKSPDVTRLHQWLDSHAPMWAYSAGFKFKDADLARTPKLRSLNELFASESDEPMFRKLRISMPDEGSAMLARLSWPDITMDKR